MRIALTSLSVLLVGCSSLSAAFDSYLSYLSPEREVQVIILQERYCVTTDAIARKSIEQALASISREVSPNERCTE